MRKWLSANLPRPIDTVVGDFVHMIRMTDKAPYAMFVAPMHRPVSIASVNASKVNVSGDIEDASIENKPVSIRKVKSDKRKRKKVLVVAVEVMKVRLNLNILSQWIRLTVNGGLTKERLNLYHKRVVLEVILLILDDLLRITKLTWTLDF